MLCYKGSVYTARLLGFSFHLSVDLDLSALYILLKIINWTHSLFAIFHVNHLLLKNADPIERLVGPIRYGTGLTSWISIDINKKGNARIISVRSFCPYNGHCR